MLKLRHFRFLNPEWFRKPQSELELTLRTPLVIKEMFTLAFLRIIPVVLVFALLVKLLLGIPVLSFIVGLLLFLLYELYALEHWYRKKLLPKQKESIELVNNMRVQDDNKELISNIEKATVLSAKGMVKIGYVGLASWGWEILFKETFPLIAKNNNYHYTDLLIGISNIVLEADQALWEVANEDDPNKKQVMYQEFLNKYGSQVDDMDLSFKTLREKAKALDRLLELNKGVPSPNSEHDKMIKRYKEAKDTFVSKVRIPRPIFDKLLDKVRSNVALREDRRFYEFSMDYKLRIMLIELGNRLGISEEELFSKSWKEIKDAAN
ncbi:hypothetical protein KKC62_03975 [Patescibacteria group bacterium]|nr:hypothetical protein [Patescibacteria group bacterium]MBU1953333.1 hypothetical protein [Patescibacteria group bacterium]